MGTADIKATFPSGEYEITVSTLHMCVLMLFNTHDELTTKNIADMTDMEPEQLTLSLQALACVKGKNILTKSPPSKDVSMGDVFSVNSSFSSKSHKVKIASISQKRETDEETAATRHKISDDRKPQIEATMVRIMKSEKRLDFMNIVAAVNIELRNRFGITTVAEIKKHIENLIEREFIARDPNDRKMYVYLA
jgi:cullin 3